LSPNPTTTAEITLDVLGGGPLTDDALEALARLLIDLTEAEGADHE
jgi:hypothetical protein